MRVLENRRDLTLDSLIGAACDNHLTAVESLLPGLLAAYDALAPADPLKAALAAQIAALRGCDVASVPTSLAIFCGQDLAAAVGKTARAAQVPVVDFMATDKVAPEQRLQSLLRASARLAADFGS